MVCCEIWLVVLTVLALFPAPCRSELGKHQVVMISGQQAPGVADGVTFRSVSQQEILAPLLNNQGDLFFLTWLEGPGVDTTNDWANYFYDGDSLRLVAREGETAAGQPRGVRYESLYFGHRNLSEQGAVAFGADLTGGDVTGASDFALFESQAGTTTTAARLGSPITFPNVGERTLTGPISNVTYDSNGFLHYSSRVNDVSGNESTQAFFRVRSGRSTPLFGQTSAYPDPLQFVTQVSLEENGGSSAAVTRLLPLGNRRVDSQIIDFRGGSATPIVNEGDLPPGYPEFTEFGNPNITTPFMNVARNAEGKTVFTSWLYNGIFAGNGLRRSVWAYDPSLDEPLREVIAATQTLAARPDFRVSDIYSDGSVQPLQINDLGDVAFYANLSSIAAPGENHMALMVERDGVLDWIYRDGEQVPGLPAGTTFYRNPTFTSESGIQMNRVGQIAFSASYRNPDGSFGGGVFLAEREGGVIPLVLRGDQVEVEPNDVREIQGMAFASDASPGGGLASGFNDNGDLAVLVRFTDDTTAILLVDAIPEPTTMSLLGFALMAPIPRRRVGVYRY
ncbi:hypothetical protein K2D_38870 [Planctomycetes bacterium K2D]|uniref:Uncharacterized protein n=2 Tax=Botrimarina mediterranea TaxID=2528022 RepID=A0A518KCW1_9BACT|nr:hypothetical protein Spa11_38460 [Botrimarina mediterranea]QDV80261.1 hypothetical protein K2D_38870 [Planctomycetes bacterium K2D]